MKIKMKTVLNPHARRVDLPFVPHDNSYICYDAGDDKKNIGEREKLHAEARIIWDELSALMCVDHLGFSPESILVTISPAYEWDEVLPQLEEYFTQRFSGSNPDPLAIRVLLRGCEAVLGECRRIAVERCVNENFLVYSFRQRIFSGIYAEVAKQAGSASEVIESKLSPPALHRPLQKIARMNEVAHVSVRPYSVTVELMENISRETTLVKILVPMKEALYGDKECEVKVFSNARSSSWDKEDWPLDFDGLDDELEQPEL